MTVEALGKVRLAMEGDRWVREGRVRSLRGWVSARCKEKMGGRNGLEREG